MMRLWLLCLLLLIPLSANAENGKVSYIGGTVTGFGQGDSGRFATAGETLQFESRGQQLKIPYTAIDSFQYTQPVAHHLGVLPAIVVGLLKHRQHRHIFQIFFHDQNGSPQVAIFQVPKHMPQTLEAIFQVRTNLCNRSYRCQDAQ